jgi:hypothetical protein
MKLGEANNWDLNPTNPDEVALHFWSKDFKKQVEGSGSGLAVL